MQIFKDFTITMSKVAGLFITVAAPFVLDGNDLIMAWVVATGLFGVKQVVNGVKDTFNAKA